MTNKEIISLVNQKCASVGRLLYLSKFGSHLYGTDTENSDSDYKGIFLPSLDSMLIGKPVKNITFSTGDKNAKNTSEDIDVSLWSVQYWLQLLQQGDTNAIDLLFSYSHKKCVIFNKVTKGIFNYRPCSKNPFKKPLDYLDVVNNKAYIGYAINQAKKYGLKGTKLDILEKAADLVEQVLNKHGIHTDTDLRFGYLFEDIKSLMPESNEVKIDETCNMIYIFGKGFQDNLPLDQALVRLRETYNRLGERAKLAKENQGVDWKAVSHAMRALMQINELIDSGKIVFPLKDAQLLKDVKAGLYSWDACSEKISNMLESTAEKMNSVKHNKQVVENGNKYIISLYY